MGTCVRCRKSWLKVTSEESTNPSTPLSPDIPANHPGAPIRTSHVGRAAHQLFSTTGTSLESSFPSVASGSGPARRIAELLRRIVTATRQTDLPLAESVMVFLLLTPRSLKQTLSFLISILSKCRQRRWSEK